MICSLLRLRTLCAAAASVTLCLGFTACGKKPPEALAPDAATNEVAGLFDQSPPEVKALADGAVQAMASDNLPRAHMLLQSLMARTDLTPEQREIVTGAFLGVGEKSAGIRRQRR